MRSERKHTLLSAFLQQLGVKHTRYADNLYNSHPYKFSLYGLSQMLSEYKVANAGMKVSDKKSGLEELAVPFIAHAGNEFVLVYKKDSKDVSYLWNGKDIRIGRERFLEIWSGNVLLAEADEESCEPDYERHRRFEWWERLKGRTAQTFRMVGKIKRMHPVCRACRPLPVCRDNDRIVLPPKSYHACRIERCGAVHVPVTVEETDARPKRTGGQDLLAVQEKRL